MKAFADAGLQATGVQLLGTGDVVPDSELQEIGAAELGMVDASIYTASDKRPANVAFVQAWIAAYGPNARPDFAGVGAWTGMAAIYEAMRKLGPGATGDAAMAVLSHFASTDGPAGPVSIDPETRDIVQSVFLCKVERVGDQYVNVVTETIPDVKDPWKTLNPVK